MVDPETDGHCHPENHTARVAKNISRKQSRPCVLLENVENSRIQFGLIVLLKVSAIIVLPLMVLFDICLVMAVIRSSQQVNHRVRSLWS